MSLEKARANYIGEKGREKLNCAQTIANAFKDKFGFSDDIVARFEAYGGGRSPEGQCGSLYAAKVMLEKSHPDLIRDCEAVLLGSAGSIKCKEIRSRRRLSCLGCVETIAECLEKA